MSRDVALGNPAVHPEEDEFNRWPFCRALADRIARLGNIEGAPVIGLYGKWGYGKSTVLNFIKHQLQQEHAASTIIFEFNPWLFKNQEALLAGFYTGLAEKIDESLTGTSDTIGKILAGYSGALGMIPVVGAGLKSLAEQVGNQIAESSLEKRHAQIIKIMGGAGRTVVVLIDDLDRLDRDEIMTMLKLVRLTADLPRVVYVLAFDDEMIAQAAGSAYGNNLEAGRRFLEKIVQFPFAIPAVGQDRLVNYVLRHAHDATDRSEITLTDLDWAHFRDLTRRSLSRRLTTPRQAILYNSSLEFALPILKDEVDPVLQMVVEGLRVLFTELYLDIRDNSDFYLSSRSDEDLSTRIRREMSGSRQDDVEAGIHLARFLFQDDRRLHPITDPYYFHRYFAYTVAKDEISDVEFSRLHSLAETANVRSLVKEFAARNAEVLLKLLRSAFTNITPKQAFQIALALAAGGSHFVKRHPRDVLTQDFCKLLAEFIRKASPGTLMDLAFKIVRRIEPLGLAILFFENIQSLGLADKIKQDDREILQRTRPRPVMSSLHKELLKRIPRVVDGPSSAAHPTNSIEGKYLFEAWRQYKDREYLSRSAESSSKKILRMRSRYCAISIRSAPILTVSTAGCTTKSSRLRFFGTRFELRPQHRRP